MTEEELFDAFDGLMAYDTGCVSSGIHDEELRARVKTHLETLDEKALQLTLSRFILQEYLTDDAIRQGYGIEAVAEFIKWLDTYMGISL